MKLDDIYIILCRPDESRNVGSACRAMANMGMKNLRIVGKKADYDEEKVKTLAIHAFSIWENAVFFDSIEAATKDCYVSAGTTRRRGKKRKEWLLTPDEFSIKVNDIENGKVAVIFGNERTGLTDEELECCTLGVKIPTDEEFGSLNLSHAVQIICYELYKHLKVPTLTGYTPITLERLSKTVISLTDDLKKVGFFSVTGRPEMENFWTSVFARAALSEGEAQYIEKIFNKAAGLISRQSSKQD
ncbi:MAG: RNA methyltransferase [Spirochaetaceae bacterium]|nr:RNA methyltransferase [Spirochaetaceae bacterium]